MPLNYLPCLPPPPPCSHIRIPSRVGHDDILLPFRVAITAGMRPGRAVLSGGGGRDATSPVDPARVLLVPSLIQVGISTLETLRLRLAYGDVMVAMRAVAGLQPGGGAAAAAAPAPAVAAAAATGAASTAAPAEPRPPVVVQASSERDLLEFGADAAAAAPVSAAAGSSSSSSDEASDDSGDADAEYDDARPTDATAADSAAPKGEAAAAAAVVTSDSFLVSPSAVAIRASFAFPSVELLIVNDIGGMDLPLLQLDVSKTNGSFLAFHVDQRRLGTFGVGVAAQYYNSAKDVWEPLLEYAPLRVEFASPQPLYPSLHTGACPVPMIAPGAERLIAREGSADALWFDPATSRSAWLALRAPQDGAVSAATARAASALRLSSSGALYGLEDSLWASGVLGAAEPPPLLPGGALSASTAPPDPRGREAAALRRQMFHQRYRSALVFDGIGDATPVVADDDEAEGEEDGDADILAAAASAAALAQPENEDEGDEDADEPAAGGLLSLVRFPRLGISSPFAIDSAAITINMKALAREQTLLLARRRAHGNAVAAGGAAGGTAPVQLPAYPDDPPYRYSDGPRRRGGAASEASSSSATAAGCGDGLFSVDLPTLPSDTYLRLTADRRINLNMTPAFVNALIAGYAQFLQQQVRWRGEGEKGDWGRQWSAAEHRRKKLRMC